MILVLLCIDRAIIPLTNDTEVTSTEAASEASASSSNAGGDPPPNDDEPSTTGGDVRDEAQSSDVGSPSNQAEAKRKRTYEAVTGEEGKSDHFKTRLTSCY